ncbi:MAG TPA: hydrogenase maturation protease [Sulfurovum sp.]|nr:hydrogenase maturation protease [Sulfurovum sp.]
MVILGIGNVLQKDDGLGVYAATYLKENYIFSEDVSVINGGVEGINLLNIFMDNDKILILDTIEIEDKPGSIYAIPSGELSGRGLNSGGAHEIGVLQCIDMLELQGKAIPETTILGIVPAEVTFDIALSYILEEHFNDYIKVALNFLNKHHIEAILKDNILTLDEIINKAKDPSFNL